MLDTKTLSMITKHVEHQFPEVMGSKPTVQVQHPPKAKSHSRLQDTSDNVFLVTYRGIANSSTGSKIPRLVRVVVNTDGKILKITTSR